ncbi:hypothetical protein M9H77_13509 [Catharanthus roseus]|uniref:Uncharacterized protein n=1 Tax=Catharanthus roseus TaxID=4058 RepID=A0ACC0BKB6_CATRO|nr:hypothetical protein M9H77_13509 [Catharanthus roseus]
MKRLLCIVMDTNLDSSTDSLTRHRLEFQNLKNNGGNILIDKEAKLEDINSTPTHGENVIDEIHSRISSERRPQRKERQGGNGCLKAHREGAACTYDLNGRNTKSEYSVSQPFFLAQPSAPAFPFSNQDNYQQNYIGKSIEISIVVIPFTYVMAQICSIPDLKGAMIINMVPYFESLMNNNSPGRRKLQADSR